MEFDDYNEISEISNEYKSFDILISCYLVNFEDDYLCHKHNGGCKNIDKCRDIHGGQK